MPPAAVGPALRLDLSLRDRARVDARLREEPLDERGRVGAVGVDDHDSEPRARARGRTRRSRCGNRGRGTGSVPVNRAGPLAIGDGDGDGPRL